MKNMKKRAVFFSIDSLIALAIIVFTVLLVYPYISSSENHSEVHEDLGEVLATLKIGEVNDSYVSSLISQGAIYELNKSVLEQIGEFYITNKTLAKQLADVMISYLDTSENIGIWYGGNLVASKNSTPYEGAKNIEVVTHMVSGLSNLENNGSITGYSARAWLSSSLAQKYFYFGGYAGDGNISILIDYTGELSYVGLEIAVSRDFDIYINGAFSGHYENSSSEFAPSKYDLSAYNSSFHDGENTIKLVGENLYIAGGYFRIIYDGFEGTDKPTRYYFPGVEGLINLYDGFYAPGQINAMDILLHMNTSAEMLLVIGNTSIYESNTSDEETITINDSVLSSLLNYSALSQKTVPIKLGLAHYEVVKPVDVFSVAELAGSMNQQVPGTGKKVIEFVRASNEVFIYAVMNSSVNRLGLVGYDSDIDDLAQHHNLSRNITSLNDTVYGWKPGAGACTCCGISKTIEYLDAQSSSSKYKTMVLMSDGKANTACWSGDAKADAKAAACDAFYNHSIYVQVIGFGPTTTIDEDTLRNISECGNGTYYYANDSTLSATYQQVARDIIAAAHSEQTVKLIDNLSTTLYPNSYIELNYTKTPSPYGLITTLENQFYDNSSGVFNLSEDFQIVEAKAVSYSGPRWTDTVKINNNFVYNISVYGNDYTKLGDPYPIHIPNAVVSQDNKVTITTGIAPDNITQGSAYNKIIYKVKQNASSYSEIVASASGCNWELEFETGPDASIKVPGDYSGAEICYYKSSGQNISNEGDAFQLATLSLLQLLDSGGDGKIDVKFTEQNLEISASEITGIPYIISTDVQIRRWY